MRAGGCTELEVEIAVTEMTRVFHQSTLGMPGATPMQRAIAQANLDGASAEEINRIANRMNGTASNGPKRPKQPRKGRWTVLPEDAARAERTTAETWAALNPKDTAYRPRGRDKLADDATSKARTAIKRGKTVTLYEYEQGESNA